MKTSEEKLDLTLPVVEKSAAEIINNILTTDRTVCRWFCT